MLGEERRDGSKVSFCVNGWDASACVIPSETEPTDLKFVACQKTGN